MISLKEYKRQLKLKERGENALTQIAYFFESHIDKNTEKTKMLRKNFNNYCSGREIKEPDILEGDINIFEAIEELCKAWPLKDLLFKGECQRFLATVAQDYDQGKRGREWFVEIYRRLFDPKYITLQSEEFLKELKIVFESRRCLRILQVTRKPPPIKKDGLMALFYSIKNISHLCRKIFLPEKELEILFENVEKIKNDSELSCEKKFNETVKLIENECLKEQLKYLQKTVFYKEERSAEDYVNYINYHYPQQLQQYARILHYILKEAYDKFSENEVEAEKNIIFKNICLVESPVADKTIRTFRDFYIFSMIDNIRLRFVSFILSVF